MDWEPFCPPRNHEKPQKCPIWIGLKTNACYNNPEKSSTVNKHATYGYSLFLYCFIITISMIIIKVKIAWKGLKEHKTKLINFEKLKILSLRNKEDEFSKKQKLLDVCKNLVVAIKGKYRNAAQNIFISRYKRLREFLVVLQNGSIFH